jgi:hypothetical protein
VEGDVWVQADSSSFRAELTPIDSSDGYRVQEGTGVTVLVDRQLVIGSNCILR